MAKLNFDIFKSHGLASADLSGRGMGAVRDWFASAGYELHQVL